MMSTYPETGETLEGKYRIEAYIGEGGMGAVARATHLIRKAPVALKFMAPSAMYQAGGVDRFLNEAVAASALKSEHIVQVLDVGTLPTKAPYLVLELLEGYDAATLVEREGQNGIDVPRAAHIVLQVLRALEVAHAAGIIHRDLKPSNCFLVHHEGDPEFVKLLDFGISKMQREGSAALTQTNAALGTPLYMSPEQARSARDVDFRCDIYSTGVILYELLCGHAPHVVDGGEFTAVLYKLFTSDAPPLAEQRAGLPPELCALVHTALDRDPGKRFASARAFAEALVPFCDGRSAIEIARLRASGATPAPGVRIASSPNLDFHSADAIAATQVGTSPLPGPITSAARSSVPASMDAALRTDLSSASDTRESAPPPHAHAVSKRGGRGVVLAGVALAAALAASALVYQVVRGSPSTRATHDQPAPSATPSAGPLPPPPTVVSAAPPPSASSAPVVVTPPTATRGTAPPPRPSGLKGIQPIQ
ncbi:MAG TPA: serine/threonine-protein kinase [Polyangiaceae bacterium]|nr:serine/threonine-protein kinase [Polyangiaceae bacterium]